MLVVQIYMTCFQGIGIVDLTQMFDLYLMAGFTFLKDYYKVLEVDYDATDEKIRLNYRRLALVGHLSFLVVPWIVFFFISLGSNISFIKCNMTLRKSTWFCGLYRSGILTSTRVTVLLLQSSKRSMKLTEVILMDTNEMVCIGFSLLSPLTTFATLQNLLGLTSLESSRVLKSIFGI